MHYVVSRTVRSPDDLFAELTGRVKEGYLVFLNQYKFSNTGHIPFTLTLLDPRHLFDFYNGQLFICAVIDLDVMTAWFAERGMSLRLTEDEGYTFEVSGADGSGEQSWWQRISRHFFERVPFEFMSLEWLMEDVAFQREQMEHRDQEERCIDEDVR